MQALQQALGYTFRDIAHLRRALTHPSTKQPDNQRLEFLGDAILEFCVSDMLYHKYTTFHIQVCCLDGSETVFLSGENGERVLQKAEFSWDSEYRLEYKYGNSGNKKMLRFVECVKDPALL